MFLWTVMSKPENHILQKKKLITYSSILVSGVPRNFVLGGGSTNSVEDRGQRERGSGGGSPLVWGSGGSCNLVKEVYNKFTDICQHDKYLLGHRGYMFRPANRSSSGLQKNKSRVLLRNLDPNILYSCEQI